MIRSRFIIGTSRVEVSVFTWTLYLWVCVINTLWWISAMYSFWNTVIPRLKSLFPRTNILRRKRKSVRLMLKMSSSNWITAIKRSRSRIMLQFGSRSPFKKLRNRSLNRRKAPRRFWWVWTDWSWLATRCLRTMIGTSSDQQHLDRELRRCFLDTRRFWRRRSRGLSIARLQCLFSSSHLQRLVHRHLYCWPLQVMIHMTCLQFKIFSCDSHFMFYCEFCMSMNVFFWSKETIWKHCPDFNIASIGKFSRQHVV